MMMAACVVTLINFRWKFVPSRTEEGPTDVHPVPDAGTGKRVPLQSLLDPPAAHRDCTRPLPHRTPNQDLVPGKKKSRNHSSSYYIISNTQRKRIKRKQGRGKWQMTNGIHR